ncbi:MAG: hypothetical protein GC145_04080 [Caulobacter sp.]|nr:hypothetical protein [Caulobacter sp.]
MTQAESPAPDHPAPHRNRARFRWLLLSLAAGPTGWICQLVVNYGLSSYACYPGDTPRRQVPLPGWTGEHLLLVAVNLIALALAVAGLLVGLVLWRKAQAEKPGGAEQLLEVGEGPTRFLASCGMMASAAFGAAILFNTVSTLAAPVCWDLTH